MITNKGQQEDNTRKTLVLLCQNYPFSHGEHLLENEVKHHLNHFNTVIIVSADTKTPQQYPVEQRVIAYRYNPKAGWLDVIGHLRVLFNSRMFKEFSFILSNYKTRNYPKLIKRAFFASIQSKKYHKYFSKILREQREGQFVFYSWWITNATLGFCLLKKKCPDLKTYSRARAVDLYLYRHSPPYLPFRNHIYENLDQVFTISNEGRQYICDHFRVADQNKIQVSRIGVLGEENLSEYNFSKPLMLVSCSGVIPLKRLDYIIDSLGLIDDSLVHWVHFGDGPEFSSICKYADLKLKEKNNISYDFKGHFANEELRSFYKNNRIDLFINLSQYEGVPVSIMEAFSFGIPAIATNVGGVNEMVNESNGFLIDVEKAPATVAAIISQYYHSDVKKKKEYRTNAHNTWKEKYNLNKNFSKLSKTIAGIE